MKATKIVELVIADDSEELAIDAISLVTDPAIQENFVYFGKEKNNLTFAKVDEEKRMLISPALIPNKQIFRHDPNTDSDYYVYFSKETVQKASELYLKHNNHHKATYQHQDRVSGVLTVESWIKEGDSDKSKLYGYDLPDGTWFVKMKIENDELWEKIKAGELKGLSIEGYFTNKFEQMNKKKEFTNEEVRSAIKELLSVQKVDLSLLDDIKNTGVKLDKMFNAATKIAVDGANKLASKVDGEAKSINEIKNTLSSEIDNFKKQVKSLGLNPNDVPNLKKFEKELDSAKGKSEALKKISINIRNAY